MPVNELGRVQIPAAISAWIDAIVLVFLGLFILWTVLKAIGFVLRRSYNLTPVATAASQDIRPDFLKVDRAAQKQLLERGREFDRTRPAVAKAVSVAGIGVMASGVVSLVSAAFLAFGRIQELDATWQSLSSGDRLVAIVESHPVGFAIALAMVVAASARFLMTLRRSR